MKKFFKEMFHYFSTLLKMPSQWRQKSFSAEVPEVCATAPRVAAASSQLRREAS